MKTQYDFTHARRGPILPAPKGKTRITIRIDDEILDWFRAQVHAAGGGNYQTLINAALRDHMTRQDDTLSETLRRVIREEVAPYIASPPRTARKRVSAKHIKSGPLPARKPAIGR